MEIRFNLAYRGIVSADKINNMSISDVFGMSHMLNRQIKAENDARERAYQQSRQEQRMAQNRSKRGRRRR